MAKSSKISKKKAVEMIADLLFTGKKRKEILQQFTENYKVSESSVDKWIKEANKVVKVLTDESNTEKMKLIKETREDIVKRLGLDMEAVLSQYKKLAFFNIKSIFTVDGGMMNVHEMDDDSAAAIAGIESYDEKEPESGMVLGTVRKIKISEKKTALDSICKVLGYDAPTKIAPTDPDGNALLYDITLNIAT